MSARCACELFYVLLNSLTMGIVRSQYSKCHSRHFFIYACADSSKWGLFSLSRSAWSPRPPSLFLAAGARLFRSQKSIGFSTLGVRSVALLQVAKLAGEKLGGKSTPKSELFLISHSLERLFRGPRNRRGCNNSPCLRQKSK